MSPPCDSVAVGALGNRKARGFVTSNSVTKLTKHKSTLKSIRVSSRKPSSPSKFKAHMGNGQILSSTQPPIPSTEFRPRLSFSSSQVEFCTSSAEDLSTIPWSSQPTLCNEINTYASQRAGLHAAATELIRKRQQNRILQRSITVSTDKPSNSFLNESSSNYVSPVKQHFTGTRQATASPHRQNKKELSQLDYFRTPAKTPRHVKPTNVTSAPPENEFAVPADVSAIDKFLVKPGGRLEQLAGPPPAELHALRTPYRRLVRNLFDSASQQQAPPLTAYEPKAVFSRSADEQKKLTKSTKLYDNGRSKPKATAFSDYFEWALLTKVRLTVAKSLAPAVRQQLAQPLSSEQRSEACLQASRNYAVLDDNIGTDGPLTAERFHTKLVQAMTFWAFPLSYTTSSALPHWSFESNLMESSTSSANSAPRTTRIAPLATGALNISANKQNILGLWETSLNDLWILTKQNFCPYFYIISHYWTALVLSPALAIEANDKMRLSGSCGSNPAKNGKTTRRGSSLVLTDSSPVAHVSPYKTTSPMILLAKPPKGCINTLRSLNIKAQLWRYQTAGAVVVGEPPQIVSEEPLVVNDETINDGPPVVADEQDSSQQQNVNVIAHAGGKTVDPQSFERPAVHRKRHRHINNASMTSVSVQKLQPSRSTKRHRAATPLAYAAADISSPCNRNNNSDADNPHWRTPSPSGKKSLNMLRTPDSPFQVGDILRGLKDAGRLKLVDEMSGSYHYRQAAIDTLQLLTISGVEQCDRFVSEFLIKQVESLLAPATTAHAYIPPLLLSPGPFLHGAQMQLESTWSDSAESNLTCLEIGGGPVMPHVAPYLALLWQQLLSGLAGTDSQVSSNVHTSDSPAGGTLAFIKHSASAVLSSFFTLPPVTVVDTQGRTGDSAQKSAKASISKAANPLEMEALIELPLKLAQKNAEIENGYDEADSGAEIFVRNGLDRVVFDCMRRFSNRNEAFMLENDLDN